MCAQSVYASGEVGGSGIIQQMMAVSPDLDFHSTFTRLIDVTDNQIVFQLENLESGQSSVIVGSEQTLQAEVPEVLEALEESANNSNEWVDI